MTNLIKKLNFKIPIVSKFKCKWSYGATTVKKATLINSYQEYSQRLNITSN